MTHVLRDSSSDIKTMKPKPVLRKVVSSYQYIPCSPYSAMSVFSTAATGIFLCILLHGVMPDQLPPFKFSTYQECVTNVSANTTNISVPKLAEQFSVRMEVKVPGGTVPKGSFYDFQLYYDEKSQRAAIYHLLNGRKFNVFYDFQNKTAVSVATVDEGRVCQRERYQISLCDPVMYFLLELAGHANISEYCRMEVSPAYHSVSSENIRDIKAQKWQQCMRDQLFGQTFKSTYHFTAPRVASPSTTFSNRRGLDHIEPVPIRFATQTLDGEGTAKTLIYDLTHYIAEVEDKSVLWPPRGVECPEPLLGRDVIFTAKSITAPKCAASPEQIPISIPNTFAFVDTIVVTNHSSKFETLRNLILTWDTASAPDAVLVHPTIIDIEPYTPTLNPTLRKITVLVTGVSASGSFDEFVLKQKYRQLVQSMGMPIPSIHLVPPAEIIPLDAAIIDKARMYKVWLQTNTTIPPTNT